MPYVYRGSGPSVYTLEFRECFGKCITSAKGLNCIQMLISVAWKGQPDWLVQWPLQLPMVGDAELLMISLSASWRFSPGSSFRFCGELFWFIAGLIPSVCKLLKL